MGELIFDDKEGIFDCVKYKFFAPNHGKSPCDSHFGKISYYYQLYTSTQQRGIHTTQHLCDMIQNMMTERHEERMKKYENSRKKPPTYEREKQLKFYAVNFDINAVPILKDAHLNQTELQYRITIPDIKSFGYFESKWNEEYVDDYESFKCDEKYHIEYNWGNCSDYRLRLKREIRKINKRQSVAYNLDLVHYKHSGHMIELLLNDNPSTDTNSAIRLQFQYSVDVIPKPVETTKNHVEERSVDIKELVRQKLARDRVRNNAERRVRSNC